MCSRNIHTACKHIIIQLSRNTFIDENLTHHLFFCLVSTVQATDYYFAANGNDANTGTQSSPFQTLIKLNTAMAAGGSGDRFYLRRGDTFLQTATIRAMKAGQTLDSYGTGALPIITSFVHPTAWTNTSGLYWQTSINCGPRLNMLTLAGTPKMRGRFPNATDADGGYVPYNSATRTQMTIPNYGATNWAANGTAEIFAKWVRWEGNTLPITAQSGSVFTFSGGNDPNIGLDAINGFGAFIENDIRTLDQLGEWFYNYNSGSPLLTYYSNVNPATLNLQVATLDTAIIISNKSNVTIQNVSIQGYNRQLINLYVCSSYSINNNQLYYAGMDAVKCDQSGYGYIGHNDINWSNNRALDITPNAPMCTIEYNTINHTGTIVGLGGTGNLCNTSIFFSGAGSICQYNKVKNMGYQGIVFTVSNVMMINNVVDSFCLNFDDGAAFYTSGPGTGRIIKKCIALNGIGNNQGTGGATDKLANDFGLDDVSEYVRIDSCYGFNTSREGYGIHNGRNDSVTNSMFVKIGQRAGATAHDMLAQNNHTINMYFYNNVYVSFENTPSYKVYDPITSTNALFLMDTNRDFADLLTFGYSDYNYFYKPFGGQDFMKVSYIAVPPGTTVAAGDSNNFRQFLTMTLPEWQRKFGQDLHSTTGIMYSPYNILTTSANQYPQGQFNTSTGSLLNNASMTSSLSWDNTGQLDGGNLKATFTGSTDTTQGFSIWFYDPSNVQDIAAGTVYLVDFDVRNGDNAEAAGNLYIQSTGGGISLPVSFKIAAGRSHVQVRFKADDIPNMINGHYINMQIQQASNSHTFYVDNFTARPATTSEINPDDYLTFVYALDDPITYQTPQPFWDYQRNAVGLTTVIPPYTAKILFRNPNAVRVSGRINAVTK